MSFTVRIDDGLESGGMVPKKVVSVKYLWKCLRY
jgi:hypothetical protein